MNFEAILPGYAEPVSMEGIYFINEEGLIEDINYYYKPEVFYGETDTVRGHTQNIVGEWPGWDLDDSVFRPFIEETDDFLMLAENLIILE